MKFLLAVLLMSLAVTFAANSTDDDHHWNSFKGAFKKNHHPRDEARRKARFLARHKKIEEHNRGNHSFKMAHNHLSDLTEEEFTAMLGAKFPVNNRDSPFTVPITFDERALPASIDYRTDSCMQPVKNQGKCGDCWAFATITPMEFNKCKLTKAPVALSEQMLVDCDTAGNNHGCNGGFYDYAWDYLKIVGGAVTNASYPYVSGSTGLPGTTCKFSKANVAAAVTKYGAVSTATTDIMTALQTYGPLPAAIKALPSLQSYSSGVYTDSACTNLPADDINHAIVIVGYGTTTTSPLTKYWVVRNSWSSSWGQGGYFLIKQGVNMCNIESAVSYVVVG